MHTRILGAFFLATVATVAQATNLVQNPSFEADGNWTFSGNAAPFTNDFYRAYLNGNTTLFGNRVVGFSAFESLPNGVVSQTITTAANANYSLTFYAGLGSLNAPSGQKLRVRVKNASDSSTILETEINPQKGTKFGPELLDRYRFDFVATGASTTVEFSDVSNYVNQQDLILDNVSVETRVEPTPVAGTISLEGIPAADVSKVRATIWIRSGTNLVELHRVQLGSSGQFFVTTALRGPHTILAKGPTWLAKSAGVINITSSGVFGLDFNLLNGDCDGDNYIGTDDYLILNGSFDKVSEDITFDPRADLNLDNYVGTDDYLLLNANFDVAGE